MKQLYTDFSTPRLKNCIRIKEKPVPNVISTFESFVSNGNAYRGVKPDNAVKPLIWEEKERERKKRKKKRIQKKKKKI